MTDVRLIDANAALDAATLFDWFISSVSEDDSPVWTNEHIDELFGDFLVIPKDTPTVDAVPVKHGHWSECYRDCRCISVICSVCKNPTVIAHGCRYADEVTMDYVIERLPHCPKCCSDMRGDADER